MAESADAVHFACFACGHEWSAPRAITMAVPGVGAAAAAKNPSTTPGFNPTPARAVPARAPTPRAMPAPLPRTATGGFGGAPGGPASMSGLGPSMPTSGFANLGPRIAGAGEPRRPGAESGFSGHETTGQFLTAMPPPMPNTDIDVDLGDVMDARDTGVGEDIDFDGMGDLMGGGVATTPPSPAPPLSGLFDDLQQPGGLVAPAGADDLDAAFLGTGAHALSARLRDLAGRLRALGQNADAETVTEALAMIAVFSPDAG